MEGRLTDFIILGFLAYGPKSGYDLKRCMAMSTAHFYEASFGSIYPSLARMERGGLVASSPPEGGVRLRRVYGLLPAGQTALREWLLSGPDVTKGPSLLLARLFFLGCLPPAEARRVLAALAAAAGKRRLWLSGMSKELPPEADFFQASTQRFGLEYYAFLEAWLGRLGAEARRPSHSNRAPRGRKKELP